MRHQIQELLEVLPEFQEAKVRIHGYPHPIDLNRNHVQHTVTVPLINTSRVGQEEAVSGMLDAYEREEASIIASLQAIRSANEWQAASGD